MKHKGLAFTFALVLAGLCGWFAHTLFEGKSDSPSEDAEAEDPQVEPGAMAVAVEVENAVQGNLTVTVTTDGTVMLPPDAVATIASRASGRVLEVLAAPGQHIDRGDVLLRFEREPLQAAALRAASELKRAQSELAEFEQGGRDRTLVELRSAVETARAEQELADAQVVRLEALRQDGLVADKAVAEAHKASAQARRERNQAEQALANFESTGAELKRGTLQAQVDASAASLDDAERQVKEADVVAPADGTVASFTPRRGDQLAPGTILGTIVTGPARLWSCPLAARDAARIALGASAHGVAENGASSGTVERIVPMASASGLVEVIVRAQDAPALLAGQVVRVEIEIEQLRNVTLVPEAAVVRAADKQVVVLVADGDRAKITEVTVLGRHGDLVAVAGALRASDRVITAGGYNLPDGARVVMRVGTAGLEGEGAR
jgi:RND family efflux transporter MFP subunit